MWGTMGASHSSRKQGKPKHRSGLFAAAKQDKSKAGWILYLMVHLPFVWWVKIGITGRTPVARANDIDKAMFGFPVPVCMVVVPGAYIWEQMLHRICRRVQRRFYDGDGSSEWFLFVAAIPALVFMLAVWGLYAWLVSLCMKWDALEWYLLTLQIIARWAVDLIK